MDCQNCGAKDALIHLTEIQEGEVINIWLCPACARERQMSGQGHEESDGALFGDTGEPRPIAASEDDLLAAFLGLERKFLSDQPETVNLICSKCGFALEQFQRTSRLGCPECYRAFEPNIRGLLSRFHGRTIHLGKMPDSNLAGQNPLAEVTRVRVALEKAVAAEDFEEAAGLRDYLKELEARQSGPEEETP